MCIGIPMQVVQCDDFVALCCPRNHGDSANKHETVDITLVGKQAVGSWLLVFLGAAREVMTETQALNTLNAVQAVENIMNAQSPSSTDIDNLFADLVDREPELPEHLKVLIKK